MTLSAEGNYPRSAPGQGRWGADAAVPVPREGGPAEWQVSAGGGRRRARGAPRPGREPPLSLRSGRAALLSSAHVGYREWRTALQAETDVMKWGDLIARTGAHVLTDRRTVTKRGQGPGGGQKRPPHGPAWEPAAGAPMGTEAGAEGEPDSQGDKGDSRQPPGRPVLPRRHRAALNAGRLGKKPWNKGSSK